MHDDIDISALSHILKEADRRFARAAEAQPVVRRHQQDSVSADLFGRQRLRDRLIAALGADARDDLDFVPNLIGDDPGDARPLMIAQRHHFARMPIADEPGDAIDRCQVAHVIAQANLIDRVVIVKGAKGGGQYAGPGFFEHEIDPF